jgi:hypothetical protein
MTTFARLFGQSAARGLMAVATIAFSTSAVLAATATAGAHRYDGLWSVSIVTEKGDCDRGYRYPIRIANGELVNGGNDPFTISGKVAPSGGITVKVSSGSKSATGSGHLAGNGGEGLWHGGSCSGTWTAERRGSVPIRTE